MKSLLNNKIIICMGSGGVGKTTVSAAIAVSAAQQGLRVLVLTIDASKRLATALGLHNWNGEERRVESIEGQLFASMIEAKSIFDGFVKDTGATDEEVKK